MVQLAQRKPKGQPHPQMRNIHTDVHVEVKVALGRLHGSGEPVPDTTECALLLKAHRL